MDVGLYVASHEVGGGDQIGGTDRTVAKTKMRGCKSTRLLRVIGKIGLTVFVGCGADDLDGVFVGTYCTI